MNTLQNIPRSEDPEFHAPVPTVIVAYPGADPMDIERLIVDPIEDAINELDDIKRMDSRSLDGVAVIQIEFHWDQDPEEKYDEVVREINRIRPDLPPDIASLEVRKAGSGLVNIVQLALVSPDATYRELKTGVAVTPRDRAGRAQQRPLSRAKYASRWTSSAWDAPASLGRVEGAVKGETPRFPAGLSTWAARQPKTSGSYARSEVALPSS
jgi:hypothetical protein